MHATRGLLTCRLQGATLQALVALVFAAYVGTLIAGDRADAGAAALTYVVVLVISVVLHEIGHAVAVCAIGGELAEIRLGFGPRVAGFRLGRARVDLRPLLIAGHVSWQPPRAVRKSALAVVMAAGLLVHLALIVVALSAGSGEWAVWRIDLLIANAGALFSNLVPRTGGFTTTAGGPNDGAQLLALLRSPGPAPLDGDPDLDAARSAYRRDGVPAALATIAATGRPDADRLRLTLAQNLLAARRFADAAGVAREASPTTSPHWHRDHLLAEALLLSRIGDLTPDPEAIAAAERAAGAIPGKLSASWRAAIAHTLALARLTQHRDAESEQMARWSLPGTTSPADRAAVLSTIGWAALRQGRYDEAQSLLQQALSSAPDEPVTRAFATAVSTTRPYTH